MKQLLAFALLLITASVAGFAQKIEAKPPSDNTASATDAAARQATDSLVTKYTLNADQAKQMYAIQQRKQRNLAEIEPMKTNDHKQYLAKLESLQRGTLASIRRILQTKEQVEGYEKTQTAVQTQRAAKRKELVGKDLSKEDVQAALLEIYKE